MAEIRTRNEVFLGIVVQPKTKQPIYVTREKGSRLTVETWETEDPAGAGTFQRMGEGYLDEGGSEYAATATASGFPRSHTPSGVVLKGGGYGTCLYTGLVLLANAESEGLIHVGSISASGSGISSTTGNRSGSADSWWRAARGRGIVTQIEGSGEEQETEEEEEDADVESYVSRRAWTKILELIRESVSEHDGAWPTSIEVKATLTRTTMESGSIDVDVYTFDSAWAHGLVALMDVTAAPDEASDESIEAWATKEEDTDTLVASKEVILGLNLAHEPKLIAEKLIRIAASLGATNQEIEDMRLRNRLGVTLPEDAEAPGGEPALVEALHVTGRRSASARGALDRLARHRAKVLPWAEIEDLP